VNHAGESGAVSIYRGQIFMARWAAPAMVPQLRLFCEHEQHHRAIFCAELERRRCRRCRSYGLCALGGWVLGLLTGLLGAKAIAATTAAVERVVLRHLERQLITLRGVDADAVTAITAIIDDETVHRDHAERSVESDSFWLRVLTPIVSTSTEIVIWLGMRL
jgi:ubiquinone biosynthesis monooxygenase Coq7